jgi:hypothetical protein
MTSRYAAAFLATLIVSAVSPAPAEATFHFMQIEQIIAGVDGSTATQAVQLRTRIAGQNLVSQGRLVAYDAAGANPVILQSIPANVPGGSAGARILLATANFSTATNPGVAPDFVLTNPIPDTYLAAGSLTFESDGGIVYWRVSWGGAAYLGSTTGALTNDGDGQFGPAWPGPLPTGSGQALLFQGASNATSTANATDYALSSGPAVFTNNATVSGTIVSLVGVPAGAPEGIALAGPLPNPVRGSMSYAVTLPRETRVQADVFDLAGRRRVALEDRVLPAGRNSLTWDPWTGGTNALPGGVYFLRLRAGGEQRSTRFILLGRGVPLIHPDDH